jgi:hypothetical protein
MEHFAEGQPCGNCGHRMSYIGAVFSCWVCGIQWEADDETPITVADLSGVVGRLSGTTPAPDLGGPLT